MEVIRRCNTLGVVVDVAHGTYELVKRAMQKQCDAYSDAELKLLIRYATESYQSMLGATTQLRNWVEAAPSKEKLERATKPRRAP